MLAALLEQQRDVEHHHPRAVGAASARNSAFGLADHRVNDGLKPGEGLGIVEDAFRQRLAIDLPAGTDARESRFDGLAAPAPA